MQEKEIKYLLTQAEHDWLAENRRWDRSVTQTNHYYDTADFALRRAGFSLRVRETAGQFLQQLKHPDTGESEAYSSRRETEKPVQGAPDSLFVPELLKIAGDAPLLRLGALTTVRLEQQACTVLLCLDENHYLHTVDYELELEFTGSLQEAQALLCSLGLPTRQPALGKYGRFLARLQE